MKGRVDHLHDIADLNHHDDAHEKQWGALVCQFLNEVAMLGEQKVVSLNV